MNKLDLTWLKINNLSAKLKKKHPEVYICQILEFTLKQKEKEKFVKGLQTSTSF